MPSIQGGADGLSVRLGTCHGEEVMKPARTICLACFDRKNKEFCLRMFGEDFCEKMRLPKPSLG